MRKLRPSDSSAASLVCTSASPSQRRVERNDVIIGGPVDRVALLKGLDPGEQILTLSGHVGHASPWAGADAFARLGDLGDGHNVLPGVCGHEPGAITSSRTVHR